MNESRRDGEVINGVTYRVQIISNGLLFSIRLMVLIIVAIVVQVCCYMFLDVGGKVKTETFFQSIKMTCDLRVVVLVISCTSWHLDIFYVSMFCDVGAPLHQCSRLTDTQDNTLKELELWDLPVIARAVANDRYFVVMKFLQRVCDPLKQIGGECRRLSEVSEIQ